MRRKDDEQLKELAVEMDEERKRGKEDEEEAVQTRLRKRML